MPKNVIEYTSTNAQFHQLADLGFSVIPIPRGSKKPEMPWKAYQTTKPSPSLVNAWADANLNVGVITGRISNIVVLDVDSKEAQELVDSLGLPETPIVRSARGKHYYFRFPPTEIRNSTNINGIELDFRGEGGLVVGPGSLHPSGAIYTWEKSPSDVDFADLPQNLLGLLQPLNKSSSSNLATPTRDDGFVEAGVFSAFLNMEIHNGLNFLREKTEGNRNNSLYLAAVRIANHVAAIGIDWTEVSQQLEACGLTIGLQPCEIGPTVASAWKSGQQTPTKWILAASNWIYVAGRDQFWSPSTCEFLRPNAFSMLYADVAPYFDGKPSRGKFADFLTRGGLIEKVIDFSFDPSKPSGIFERNGEKFYNSYSAPDITALEGDASPLIEYLQYLVPADEERAHLEKMIAWIVRNPGKKLGHALLLQSKKQGIGKTTLVDIVRELLGVRNTRKTNSEEMAGNYQSYLADTLLVVLEELNLGSGIGVYNKLKDLITGETAIINEKYQKQKEVPNRANFMFLSNMDAPLLIEQDDRRIFVINSPAEKRDADYWRRFHSWWRGNLDIVKFYFESIDLSDFKPHAAPPTTEAKERLKQHSETPLAQELRAMINDGCHPFNCDVFRLNDLTPVIRQRGFRWVTVSKLTGALNEIGCISKKQIRLQGSDRGSVWVCRNFSKWTDATPEKLRSEYGRRVTSVQSSNDSSMLEEAS